MLIKNTHNLPPFFVSYHSSNHNFINQENDVQLLHRVITQDISPLTTWMLSPVFGFHILNDASSEPVHIVLPSR